MAASYKIFGVHDWSARLPIALGMLALLLVVYRIGRRFYGDEGGLYAALALGTGFGPFIYTRFMIPEMLVALWLAMGFDFFLMSLEQSERGEQPSLLGLLGTCGDDGAECPDQRADRPGFSYWNDLYLSAAHEKSAPSFAASAVFKLSGFSGDCRAVASAGGLAQSGAGRGRGFFWFYFVNEHFLRFLKKRFPADYDTVPLWLFWGLMLVWLMPWTAFIVQAIRQVPAKLAAFRAGMSAQQRATLIFALWPLVILLFFSFSSRQEYYVLPGLPGVALLLGGWLARESASAQDSPERRSGKISSIVLVAVGVAVCVVCVTLAMAGEGSAAKL